MPILRFLRPIASGLLLLACLALPSIPAGANEAQPKSDGQSKAYVITNTDRIRIAVYQEDDLSVISRVDAQGSVNLPLVGAVTVAELTVEQAERTIEKAYQDGRFLRTPKVTINVEEYAPREVSIQGQIRSPGRYPLPIESSMTILELVTRAGGLTDTAKGTAINITRVLPDGKKQTYTVDVESMIKGRRGANVSDNSLILQTGDIIFVPERLF
ncbi:MAG: polysaccharide biosynthesis/export family protein [Verrucomicrobiota bacterium]